MASDGCGPPTSIPSSGPGDPASRLPLRFTGFDWPADGNAEKPLGERYCYDDLDLDAVLSAKDFDPANPEYEFHRF